MYVYQSVRCLGEDRLSVRHSIVHCCYASVCARVFSVNCVKSCVKRGKHFITVLSSLFIKYTQYEVHVRLAKIVFSNSVHTFFLTLVHAS